MEKNYYIPQVVKIKRVIQEAPDVRTFFINKKNHFIPGQFLQVSVFGVGEVPISISSAPEEDYLQFTVKRVGRVTDELFKLQRKDSLGVRGPFGNGFNIKELEKKNLIFVAGGLGIGSLRSLFRYCLNQRKKFSNVSLLYGARTPQDIIYEQELKSLSKETDIATYLTVEKAESSWEGNVGVVTDLLRDIKIKPRNTIALICGPSVMMRFCVNKLLKKGMVKKSILFSLKRHMKCGIGKCGHCYIGEYFVCKDGPVFTLSDLEKLKPEQVF